MATATSFVAVFAAVLAGTSGPEGFDAAARRHRSDYSSLVHSRGGAHPDVGMLTLEAMRAVLGGVFEEGTAVLLYTMRNGGGLDAFLVSRDGLLASASIPSADLRGGQRIARMQRGLGISDLVAARAPRRRGVRTVADARSASDAGAELPALAETLFPGPIAAALAQVRHLVVVPAGDVSAVPFAALQPGGGPPLVERMPVTIAPSLYGLGALDDAPGAQELAPAAIVGDPDLGRDPEWAFPPLPGARREATRVARLLGTEPILGRSAGLEEVRRRARDARLLYLATHGVAWAEKPLDGFVALSGRDGVARWTAWDVQDERLPTRLVVLSACQTGLGAGHEGGMIGLARAFQLAGASNVVMSLWAVDDAVTERLMTRFVELAATLPPAEALRRAMLATRLESPHPAGWASFAVLGTPATRPDVRLGTSAELVLVRKGTGEVVRDGGRVVPDTPYRFEVEGLQVDPRDARVLFHVGPGSRLETLSPAYSERLGQVTFTPEGGQDTFVLVEASSRWWLDRIPPELPATYAALAAAVPWDEPNGLRILRLRVTTDVPPRGSR